MDAPPDSPDGLREKIKLLEEENARLESRLENEEEESNAAWRNAELYEGDALREERAHRETKKACLEFLRKIEWCSKGSCPSCGYGPVPGFTTPPRHGPGCELKLEIWKLEAQTLPGSSLRAPVEAR